MKKPHQGAKHSHDHGVSGAKRPTNAPHARRPASAKNAANSTVPQRGPLRGWKAIADFLALPVATAQRWARNGMPVQREGRFTVADADELRGWLGKESEMPEPAHIATNTADLAAGLRQSISAVRRRQKQIG